MTGFDLDSLFTCFSWRFLCRAFSPALKKRAMHIKLLLMGGGWYDDGRQTTSCSRRPTAVHRLHNLKM